MADVFIAGPAGRLEAVYQPGKPGAPLALILHPNPQLGGTMNNKVVYALFQAFAKMGFATLRFNFRGVGKSQGVFDGDPNNELADTLAALDWLKAQNPDSFTCWIGGYSFGAFVGCQILMRRPDVNGFVAVSPPANVCDFSFLAPCPANGLIVQGDQDTVVYEPSVATLAERLDAGRRIHVHYVLVEGADHVYTNKLKDVYDAVLKHVPELINAKPKKSKKKSAE